MRSTLVEWNGVCNARPEPRVDIGYRLDRGGRGMLVLVRHHDGDYGLCVVPWAAQGLEHDISALGLLHDHRDGETYLRAATSDVEP